MSYWLIFIFGVFLVSASDREFKVADGSDCYKNEKNRMLWDLAHYCVSKARDIYLNENLICPVRLKSTENSYNEPSKSNSILTAREMKEKSFPYLEKADQLIKELQRNNFPGIAGYECSIVTSLDPVLCEQKPLDCSDILRMGFTQSGVYMIWPAGKALEVYCDMVTNGGGWTVIQRRGKFPVQEEFFRVFNDYKHGFGNSIRDFWLGNENIYLITNQSEYEIRFDLVDAEGNKRHAAYKTFWLDDENSSYTLHIGNYSGDAGDSMSYHNNNTFSTKDMENSRCAKERTGGWWYNDCTESNLNGQFIPGVDGRHGITWYSWHNTVSLAGSEMKIRKKN